MTYRQCLAGFVALSVCFAAGVRVEADEIDISGSWQNTTTCPDVPAQAVGFSTISEDVTTGALTITGPPGCGTILVDGSIREISSCSSSPSPGIGTVSGTTFRSPPSGFNTSDFAFKTPFASNLFQCLDPPIARLVIDTQTVGTITDDGAGKGVRTDAVLNVGKVTAFNTIGDACFFVDNAAVNCSVVSLRNDTAEGTDQTVEPIDGASVTFSQVTSAGTTSITPLTEPGGEVPANFQLFAVPLFFDVTTAATVSGPITVCLPYADADNDGFVDGTTPPIDENALDLLHEEGGLFVKRTVSRDPVKNQICAAVSALSQFVLGAGQCAATPKPGCRTAAKSLLLMKRKGGKKDKLVWKWIRGEATPSELGDPIADTDYALCVYNNASLVLSAQVPADNTLWSPLRNNKGFRYQDKGVTQDGIRKIQLQGSDTGKSKLVVKGKGGTLPFTDMMLPLAEPANVKVQLINGLSATSGICWESTYSGGQIKKNDGEKGLFKAKTP